MQKFKNILLTLDHQGLETAALDKAVSLARQNSARLTLLTVIKEPPGLQGYSDVIVAKQRNAAFAESREWLRSLMLPIEAADIEVEMKVLEGITFLEVIRQVIRKKHDLVITTAEQKQGIRERLFGTTSMHLMRKCPCPVWVIKRGQTKPFTRIMAAVDPYAAGAEADSLNPLIMRLASSIARQATSQLHIVHVWYLPGERYGQKQGMNEDLRQAKTQAKTLIQKRFDDLLDRSDIADLKPHLHLIEGEPDQRIAELVIEQDIDLLVMGTVCRTGIAGFLIGSTAEEVLNQVDCSVLTVKPNTFITPVSLA